MSIYRYTTLAFFTVLLTSFLGVDETRAQFDDSDTTQNSPPATAGALKVGSVPKKQFSDARNGMSLESNSVTAGLKVIKVAKFSLGERNGLEEGDVILSVNRTKVSSSTDLQNAFNAVGKNVKNIPMQVLNVRTGQPISFTYHLTTVAGQYQSNFGTISLTETPTNTQGVSLLEGELHFPNGGSSMVKGTLSGNQFRGTSTHKVHGTAALVLTKGKNFFDGTVTQNNKHRILFVKIQ